MRLLKSCRPAASTLAAHQVLIKHHKRTCASIELRKHPHANHANVLFMEMSATLQDAAAGMALLNFMLTIADFTHSPSLC